MSRLGDTLQIYPVKMTGNSARGRSHDKHQDLNNSSFIKDDSTMFSRKDMKKSEKGRPESLMKNRSYLRQKKTTDDSNIVQLDQSSHIDLDRSLYTHSNRNVRITPSSNKANLNLTGHGFQGKKNIDFTLYTQEKSARGRSENSRGDVPGNHKDLERNLNYSRKGTDDAIGDDEPVFPTILNKRELLKNDRANLQPKEFGFGKKFEMAGELETGKKSISEEDLDKGKKRRTSVKAKPSTSILGSRNNNSNNKSRVRKGTSEDPRSLKEKQVNEDADEKTLFKKKVNLKQVLHQLASFLDDGAENEQSGQGPKQKQGQNAKNKKMPSKQASMRLSQVQKDLFPELSKQGGGVPKGFDMINFKNKTYFLTQKVSVKPRYLDSMKRQSHNSSLVVDKVENLNNSYNHVSSSIQKRPSLVETAAVKKQVITGKNFIEKNRRIVSNLLKPISNGPRNYLKSQAPGLREGSRNFRHSSAQSSRSKISETSLTPKNRTSQKSFRFKPESPCVDNNNLVRELYRVRGNSSRKSLSVRSEGDIRSERRLKSENSFVQEGPAMNKPSSRARISQSKQQENVSLDASKGEIGNTIMKEGESKNHDSSYLTINYGKNKQDSPSHSQTLNIQQDGLSSNLDNSFSRNRKSQIEKFGKEWEEQKKRVENGGVKDAPIIQFSSTEGLVKGKSFVFEKTERISPFLYKDKAPGPGKYKVQTSSLKGYSFGKEKRTDITELPVLEDVNRMLDPVRFIKLE